MSAIHDHLAGSIDAERLRRLTLDLVATPSPTGDSAAVAARYARALEDAGVGATLVEHEGYPGSPSVVARLGGARPGPVLQLDGHLDTIHTAHDPPAWRDGRIYGRGSTDMKSGLAAMVEVARLLREQGGPPAGDLLITAHGMHEAPWARGETLRQLIAAGHVGDAAICCEGDPHRLPVVGKGLAIFEVEIRRPGEAVHEVTAPADLPHPILVGHRLVQGMLARNAEFAATELPYGLGPETYFVGLFQSGDFYNRVPTSCRIVGTRRYAPDRSFEAVEAEFAGLLRAAAGDSGAGVDADIWKQRDGFEVDPEAAVCRALRGAYAAVHGRDVPLTGMKAVADSSIFIKEAGVPALQYGPGLAQAHADVEWVALADVVDTARVLLLTALDYLGAGDSTGPAARERR